MAAQRPSLGSWLCPIICLVWLCWAAPAPAQFFSPGPLTSDHATLEGDAHCADCHSAGRGVQPDKCTSCHADVGRTLEKKTGLHGKTFAGKACGSCHVEHRGREHQLVRWDERAFDHRQAGWLLGGAHARTECQKCHTNRNERGEPTFIGLETGCVTCHDDVHRGRFGSNCQSCHDDRRWKNVDLDPFDHALARFALRGKHQRVACAKCHGQPAKYQPLAFGACTDCHRDPHQGRLGGACESCHDENAWKKTLMRRSAHPGVSLANGHARVACKSCHDRGNLRAPSRGGRCASCHAPVHEAPFGSDCQSCHEDVRWLGLPDALGRRVHARTAYPLEGRHESTPCSSCHAPSRPRAKRYRSLRFGACLDCHRDVHRAQFAERSGGACESCHDVRGFTPTSFGVEAHRTTALALVGAHEATPCGACHTGKSPRLDWQLEQRACVDCHENPHGTRFEREQRGAGCAACHATTTWDLPRIAHDSWPLTGRHASLRCDQCHAASEQDQRAGAGPSYRTAPRECEGCHADVHLGQFRATEPKKSCDACHDTRTFELQRFDHVAHTGYALTGKHQSVRCSGCHLQATLADGRRSARWRLPYKACRDCHADPHTEAAR
jgi:hypothetical protein